jgi:MFS transporter, SP family, sugar:H+ symporter
MASWSVQNVVNFVTSFTVPYLTDAGYANLGAKVGFIYGTAAVTAVAWAYFYYPELTGRSLEEIDEMLRQGVPARETICMSTSRVLGSHFCARIKRLS